MTAATIYAWTCTGTPKHELSVSDEGKPQQAIDLISENIRLLNGKPCAVCGASVQYSISKGHVE